VLERFATIEREARKAGEIGANLGHVLAPHGGATAKLRMTVERDTVRYAIADQNGEQVVSAPAWRDSLSGMRHCFVRLPLAYLHHDDRINPRNIGANLRGLVEEFYHKRPQLQVGLAWWKPEDGNAGKVHVFDGQHKAAPKILLGVKELPVRLFIDPDLNVLLEANTNAGDKLKQVAFDAAVKRHLGSALYQERVEDFQRLKGLGADDYSFSEADMVKLFRGEHREVARYIVDAVRDNIIRDPENKIAEYIEWSGKGADRPLSYSTVEKTFYSEFLYMGPLDTPLGLGLDQGTNPRQVEREQIVRLMSVVASVFFAGAWNPEIGGRKLEDRVLKGQPIPLQHLKAWRVAREEVLTNVLKWVRLAIEHYFAFNREMVDKERLMHQRFPDIVWTTVETVLRNIGDLPCWTDKSLARTIFGSKPNRDFWRKIFVDGVSPTGIRVLASGLDLRSLITPKGGA
jgi:hypothetical protein